MTKYEAHKLNVDIALSWAMDCGPDEQQIASAIRGFVRNFELDNFPVFLTPLDATAVIKYANLCLNKEVCDTLYALASKMHEPNE